MYPRGARWVKQTVSLHGSCKSTLSDVHAPTWMRCHGAPSARLLAYTVLIHPFRVIQPALKIEVLYTLALILTSTRIPCHCCWSVGRFLLTNQSTLSRFPHDEAESTKANSNSGSTWLVDGVPSWLRWSHSSSSSSLLWCSWYSGRRRSRFAGGGWLGDRGTLSGVLGLVDLALAVAPWAPFDAVAFLSGLASFTGFFFLGLGFLALFELDAGKGLRVLELDPLGLLDSFAFLELLVFSWLRPLLALLDRLAFLDLLEDVDGLLLLRIALEDFCWSRSTRVVTALVSLLRTLRISALPCGFCFSSGSISSSDVLSSSSPSSFASSAWTSFSSTSDSTATARISSWDSSGSPGLSSANSGTGRAVVVLDEGLLDSVGTGLAFAFGGAAFGGILHGAADAGANEVVFEVVLGAWFAAGLRTSGVAAVVTGGVGPHWSHLPPHLMLLHSGECWCTTVTSYPLFLKNL